MTSFPTPTDTNGSKADRAYEQLLRRLVLLDIAPGDAINELELAAEFDLGRTPIREALKRLEQDHLVTSFPRRGTFAASIDPKDLAMISELRAVLEPIAAQKAAAARGGRYREEYEELLRKLSALAPDADPRTTLELDLDTHRLVYSSIDNHHLTDTLRRLDNLATRIWGLVSDRIPNIGSHVHEHTALLRAILDGDGNHAADLAVKHVRDFEATVRAAL